MSHCICAKQINRYHLQVSDSNCLTDITAYTQKLQHLTLRFACFSNACFRKGNQAFCFHVSIVLWTASDDIGTIRTIFSAHHFFAHIFFCLHIVFQ